MLPWTLRPAQLSDAPDLWQLEAACFEAPWPLDLIRQSLRDPKYRVLCAESACDRRLLGYAAAWSVLDEGQVDRLAVLPSQRRQGLGRALLDALLDELRGAGAASVFLEVRVGNEGAIALYEAAGFARVGVRRGYYDDGEDAVVMRWDAGADSARGG